ncbi:DUF2255 family protein [Rufibacter tibetensis]|uniref:DUF2255 domain-containing protein n=1 Tax=Rufibacter tibetensis TaxID=512763 RepID=A0A0P0CRF9_9BACT|nr:DUF2255 family protein [Rufibacter tibetensis]ALI99036.1 hypothetical protein DC20_08675 [Rufibacter tibetensis]
MNTHQLPQDFIKYLGTQTLAGIKGGKDRDTFLDIWMVEVAGRVFARSWGKSNRSWFTAFLEQGVGELKYDDNVIAVTGKPLKDSQMNLLIDKAYQEKYTQEHNLIYVKGITQPEYHEYTMEFFLRD